MKASIIHNGLIDEGKKSKAPSFLLITFCVSFRLLFSMLCLGYIIILGSAILLQQGYGNYVNHKCTHSESHVANECYSYPCSLSAQKLDDDGMEIT